MNTAISKPENTNHIAETRLRSNPLPHGSALSPPKWRDELLVDKELTQPEVMAAICEDCSKDSLRYVLRSDTGHDGE